MKCQRQNIFKIINSITELYDNNRWYDISGSGILGKGRDGIREQIFEEFMVEYYLELTIPSFL